MAQWLYLATVLWASLGATTSARSLAGVRSLLQQPVSAQCGTQGYIVGQAYCLHIGDLTRVCQADEPCACPTTRTGLNAFECYDPAVESCSNTSPQWPLSGKINGAGQSNEGACPFDSNAAPAPAPALGPAPAPGPSAAPAPMSQAAPSM
ncbi:hypothetical protein ABBQ32_013105 [Trebouxia sp. C0010 RCD-2024]